MATPIKDRGIRWEEKYSGEKSAYLKREMDSQIGPGAYNRWEGRDPTTGTDYYAVVSPGLSKKKGYHFFAGLRKMPAKHGASGKKFKTQSEALSYAMDTWMVPKPSISPLKPGGYNVSDIQGKSIITESQHKKSAYNLHKIKLGMSVLNMGEGKDPASFDIEMGPQIIADDICWAYKASKVVGFLPALYMRKKFVISDTTNKPIRQDGINEFSGKKESLPPSPLYARYEEPPEEDFRKKVIEDGIMVPNDLIDINRKNGKIVGDPVKKPGFGLEPGRDYNMVRWNQVRIKPTITFSDLSHFSSSRGLWQELIKISESQQPKPVKSFYNMSYGSQESTDLKAIEIPEQEDLNIINFINTGEIPDKIRKQPKTDPISVRVNLDPEVFPQFREICLKYVGKPLFYVPKGEQSDLVDLMDYYKEKGESFPWDEPFFEQIRARGSQLLSFSKDFMLPESIIVFKQKRNLSEADTEGGENTDIRYEIKKSKRPEMIAKYASKDLEDLGKAYELMTFIDDPYVYLGRKNLGSSPRDRYKRKIERERLVRIKKISSYLKVDLPPTFEQLVKDKEKFKQVVLSIYLNMLNKVKVLINSQTYQKDNDSVSRQLEVLNNLKKIESYLPLVKTGEDFEKLKKALGDVSSYLWGFSSLAMNGLVELTSDMVVDSRTCSNKRFDYKVVTYDINQYHMPKREEDIKNKRLPVVNKTYAPKRKMAPYFEERRGAKTRAGRWFDPKRGYVYGPIPEDTLEDESTTTGLSVILPPGEMVSCIPKPNGEPYKIPFGQYPLYNTERQGKSGLDRILGGDYRISIGPQHASVKATDIQRIKNNVFREGILINRSQVFAEMGPSGYKLKENSPSSVTNADPKNRSNKNLFTVTTKNGSKIFLGQYAYRIGNEVVWKDAVASKLFVQKTLGMTSEEFGPFTPYTKRDVHLIDHIVADAISYYEAVASYEEVVSLIKSLPKNKAEEEKYKKIKSLLGSTGWADPASLSPEMKAHLDLVKKGEEYIKNLDEQKYEYGRICASCSGQQRISEELFNWFFNSIEEVIENPKRSLDPKTMTVLALQYEDGTFVTDNHEWSLVKNDGSFVLDSDGEVETFENESKADYYRNRTDKSYKIVPFDPEVIVFGTIEQANRRKESEKILAKSTEEREKAEKLEIVPYVENAMMPFSYDEKRDPSKPLVQRSSPVMEHLNKIRQSDPNIRDKTPNEILPVDENISPQESSPVEEKTMESSTSKALSRMKKLSERLVKEGKNEESESVNRVMSSIISSSSKI